MSVRLGTWSLLRLGLQLGGQGVPTEYSVNMVQKGIFYAGLALPIATVLFGIERFARERRFRGEHREDSPGKSS